MRGSRTPGPNERSGKSLNIDADELAEPTSTRAGRERQPARSEQLANALGGSEHPWSPADEPLPAVLHAVGPVPSETAASVLELLHGMFTGGRPDFTVHEGPHGLTVLAGLRARRRPIGKIRVLRSTGPRGAKLVAISRAAHRHLLGGPLVARLRRHVPGVDRPLW